jgi:AcrR family transcriptional regulator
MAEAVGLRERKNARTRMAIQRAAAQLALEQGYDHTTVDQIAARADVAPRTVYVRYPTKESIIFTDDDGVSMRDWIESSEGDLVDRLVRFVEAGVAAAACNTDAEYAEFKRLKLRAMWHDPYLRRILRGKLEETERLVAAQVAKDLGLGSDDSGPRVFAAAITELFMMMVGEAVERPESFNPLEEFATAVRFLRGGLDAMKNA